MSRSTSIKGLNDPPGLEPSFAPIAIGEAAMAGLHILQPVQTQEIIKSLFHVLFDHDSHFAYNETYKNQNVFFGPQTRVTVVAS